VVTAAGNDNRDCSNDSPASSPSAITVSSTRDAKDQRDTNYANFGASVDIYAPGTNIFSAWSTGDTDYKVRSDTDMSRFHVLMCLDNGFTRSWSVS
jgi:subtilisin family serine protease